MNAIARNALAGMLVLAGVSGAEAQEGLGTVVCVGSELESMASAGPVRRVIRKDVELVYRAAVELADREEIEEGLVEELGEHAEVRCTWSEPGNSHVVVVSYTGVIPLDLTIDPDDPRFQGFSVGYGTDWDGAEADARADARFDTYYDGSGYEVIVREQWNVGAARGAGGGGAGHRPGDVFRDCAACPEMVVVPAGSFMMGSPASEEGRSGRRRPPPPGDDRVAVRGGGVRGDVCGVGRVREGGGVRGISPGGRGLGPCEPTGDQRELGGCAGVCAVAVAGDGGGVPAAQRGGVGVCGAGGDADGAILGGERVGAVPVWEWLRCEPANAELEYDFWERVVVF